MKKTILLFILIVFLFGCERKDVQDIKALNDKVKMLTDLLDKTVVDSKSITDLATQQADKVMQVEYKVLTLPKTPEDLQQGLELAGKERWECFSVLSEAENYQVVCKRLPLPIVRALLKLWHH